MLVRRFLCKIVLKQIVETIMHLDKRSKGGKYQ